MTFPEVTFYVAYQVNAIFNTSGRSLISIPLGFNFYTFRAMFLE